MGDFDGDGDMDISAVSTPNGAAYYGHHWLGNGDGTFDSRISNKFRLWKGLGDGF